MILYGTAAVAPHRIDEYFSFAITIDAQHAHV